MTTARHVPHRPTLGRKLLLTNVVLLAGLVVLGVVAGAGLLGLRETVFETVEEYEEARRLADALRDVDAALAMAGNSSHSVPAIERRLVEARATVERFLSEQRIESHFEAEHQAMERSLAESAMEHIDNAQRRLLGGGSLGSGDDDSLASALQHAERALRDLISATDVGTLVDEAKGRSGATILFVAASSLVLTAGCVAVSVLGYRGVMRPLRRLRDGSRRIARGEFGERLDTGGDAEIAAVAREFNEMAEELDGIYRTLERRIVEKGRELARSERLASVGFLAAGVAHEISTPLNIISGYAEMSRRWLAGIEAQGEQVDETREAIDTIAQEAFRCRKITEQLLSLARMGDGVRTKVALKPLLEEIASVARAPGGPLRDRQFVKACGLRDTDRVLANASELKQVLLNLLSNAVEATKDGEGRVELRARTEGGAAIVEVRDNGVGIEPSKLHEVFEPFYSARSDGRQGTGLGLSISSAIIEAHGGTLRAVSDGPGKGAAFVIRIPLANEGARHG